MSSSQLLLTLLIALVVFGPDKLPMLAQHAGRLIALIHRNKQQIMQLMNEQLNQQQLQENTQKALKADAVYQKEGTQ